MRLPPTLLQAIWRRTCLVIERRYTPEARMFTITDYALPDELAEQVADEVRDYIQSAAQAREEVESLRSQLAKAQETIDAYSFALATYGWTAGPTGR
jgi:hypothetical protein